VGIPYKRQRYRIVSLQGRYGGMYADPIIAMDFEMWLLTKHGYYLREK
jgi:hypothetical protein